MKKIPCFILVRKNSKSIKNKNRLKFGKLSLVEKAINFVKKNYLVNDVVVSTDDKIISKIAIKKNCFTIFPRPKKLSSDTARAEDAMRHALKIYEKKFGSTDISSYIQVTEIFKPKKILDKCIKVLKKNKNIDSCFAAYKQYKNFWIEKKGYLQRISPYEERYKPRQSKKPILREDTGIALATRSKFIRKGERIGKKVKCIQYDDPFYSFDLNTKKDLRMIKKIYKI